MNYILEILVPSVWFLLPAYFANIAPLLVAHLKFLRVPVDLGQKWQGKPLFGSNKTFGGFFLGIAAAIATTAIQRSLFVNQPFLQNISIINYSQISIVLLGVLMGFGALFGDLIKSFFKRRMGIDPGKPWVPFDQADFILGTIIISSAVYNIPLTHIITMIIVSIALHFATVYIGFILGIRKSKV